ncbi:Rieske (2Fe-2S) protein [Pseudoteredinibacter isoporae]|uniref:Nitrite reductase/ring-hydroxylating ferredoxin subunit n=1 Tax=Pseudoteredinibacter isoporae TaxID=570281 RepID=A0A7X0JW05_9GAMM|nr:Rieske (2Fe-2S) protein [Pseudoteredinibacter isoporae]MBB6523222.1 nitrite reductase/ring-hydroxylating ferredoxin subunit [Pseudoteredinibacter isoporae]NHO88739.1 Rieske (2Fe-2S) protein [Pseudoteredinibacter isoporae]NIB22570.1 Rieske (2Fe-2S) protein [Pseudoteredinibacter isoporae]
MAFYPLIKLHQLVDGYRASFRIAGREILLIQENGRSYLLDARCPHAGRSLAHGSCDGQILRCPAHGMGFRLSDLQCVEQPSLRLSRYPLAYDGDTLGIEL